MPDKEKTGYTRLPFEAYLGDEPYAFISYAHQDENTVYQEITKWHQEGFNLWYDEGISAAGEWLEEIAEAIGGCSLFVVLISPRSVLSQFVKNEILYALDKSRPFLAIHMEKTGLPKGLELCMSGHQALRKYELEEDRFYRKLHHVLQGFLDTSGSNSKIDLLKPSGINRSNSKIDTRHLWPLIDKQGSERGLVLEESPEVEELKEIETAPPSESAGSAEDRVIPDTVIPEIEIPPLDGSIEEKVDLEHYPDTEGTTTSEGQSEFPATARRSLDNFPVLGKAFMVSEIECSMLWVNPGELCVNMPWSGDIEEVPIKAGFWLGERLVTQGDYIRIVGRHTNYFWDSDQLPIEQVSWLDCIEFCKALTALEQRGNRIPDGYEFRLPLELEWEYACRAGTITSHFFGSDPEELFAYAWVRGNSKHRTHQVCRKKPNPWGFYDMYGNVREWVQDSYFTSINEGFAKEIPEEFRISRGGGYMARRKDCDSSSRETNSLFHRFRNLGFRIAFSEVRENVP
ncbi:MAG: SUMF1/EgtB/PvdO family nonheme iron enzyme [Opitutales bacterium]